MFHFLKYPNGLFSLVLAIALVMLQSCAVPAPLYRLTPEPTNVRWLSGRAYLSDMKDSIAVVIGYVNTSDRHIIFDVEISNYSSEDILVDPATFKYQGLNAAKENLFLFRNNQNIPALGKAKDPEYEILETFKQENIAIAREKNARTAAIVTAVAATTAAVGTTIATAHETSTDKKASPEQKEQKIQAAQAANVALMDLAQTSVGNAVDVQQRTAFEKESLQELRQNWEQTALRKTHFGPNQRMRGSVVFGRMDEAAYITFSIWVADKEFPFLYKQQKIVVTTPISN